jgi:UDP-N-acetylmuramate--alanine ligase
MILNQINNIFFLGIGGIGMSALARYFLAKGVRISGYDRTPTALTNLLQKQGMQIGFKDDPYLIPEDCQMVIYTPAVPVTSNLYNAVQARQIPSFKRATVLGMISANIPTIAVAGTHGKTTISTMITHLLKTAAIEFCAFLGGISSNYNTNYIHSDNPAWMVVEADEFDRSFLHLSPHYAVISSMDADHLDIYGSSESMIESFRLFAKGVDPSGAIVLKKGLDIEDAFSGKIYHYHLSQPSDLYASKVKITSGSYKANVKGIIDIEEMILGLPGKHNLENALAAITIANLAGVDKESISQGMQSFRGVKRRFEMIVNTDDLVFIDDYAHHPEEIRACIESVREMNPGKKITGIFQPHLFSRTRDLAEGFANSLALLDKLLLLDIYPARELPLEGIDSQWLLDKVILKNKLLVTPLKLIEILKNEDVEVLLTMGAGDIDLLVKPIKEVLEKRFLS